MRKLFKISLAFLMACAVTIHPKAALSNNNDNLDLADKTIRENIVELYEEAQQNGKIFNSKASLVDQDDNKIDLVTYEIDTTSLTKQNKDAMKSKTYVTRASGTLTEDGFEQTGGVYVYITIYYTTRGTTPDEYLLTKVSGGYAIQDPQISVTSQSIRYACVGNWPILDNSQNVSRSPTTSSWSYNTGFTRYFILDGASIGANSLTKFKRGASTWSLQLINNLV